MTYIHVIHSGSWHTKAYCPIRLGPKERPDDCGRPIEEGGMICEMCEKFLKEKGLTFRGYKYARKNKGTQQPSSNPKDTVRDKRFKKKV